MGSSTGDCCFLGDYATNANLEQAILQNTPDLANHFGRYSKGSQLFTKNRVVKYVKMSSEFQRAQVVITCFAHKLDYHTQRTT